MELRWISQLNSTTERKKVRGGRANQRRRTCHSSSNTPARHFAYPPAFLHFFFGHRGSKVTEPTCRLRVCVCMRLVVVPHPCSKKRSTFSCTFWRRANRVSGSACRPSRPLVACSIEGSDDAATSSSSIETCSFAGLGPAANRDSLLSDSRSRYSTLGLYGMKRYEQDGSAG